VTFFCTPTYYLDQSACRISWMRAWDLVSRIPGIAGGLQYNAGRCPGNFHGWCVWWLSAHSVDLASQYSHRAFRIWPGWRFIAKALCNFLNQLGSMHDFRFIKSSCKFSLVHFSMPGNFPTLHRSPGKKWKFLTDLKAWGHALWNYIICVWQPCTTYYNSFPWLTGEHGENTRHMQSNQNTCTPPHCSSTRPTRGSTLD